MTRITVAVITKDRPAMLQRCLESLRSQTRGPDEVVVIDNGAGDASEKVAAGFADIPLLYGREPVAGYSRARNAALQKASGDLVLFTDDDCLADPDWCRALSAPLFAGEADIAGGAKLPPPGAGYAMRTDYLNTESFALHPSLPRGPARALSTSNWAMRREDAAALGGFDERYPSCEDRDLSLRASKRGLRLLFEPRALVVHIGLSKTIPEYLAKMRRYGRGTAFCLLDHPEEPFSIVVPRRAWLAALLSPLYAVLIAAYFLWRNLEAGFPRVLWHAGPLCLAAFWWQWGLVEGAALHGRDAVRRRD